MSYLGHPNDNSKLGITAALNNDPAIYNPLNITGFTNIFGVPQFNMDSENMNLGRRSNQENDIPHEFKDVREALAFNI
jgi:hypothetical protein